MAQNMANSIPRVPVITAWSVISDRKTYIFGHTDLIKLDMREKLSGINTPTLTLGASFSNKEIVMTNYQMQFVNFKCKKKLC